MPTALNFARSRRTEILVPIILLIVAACFLFYHVNRPFVDYDEATYAKVVVDTMATGDISTFTFFHNDWFEKPPLYLWMAIGSVKVFGPQEFAFRLPSIFLALICLAFVYLIMKELTKSWLPASLSLLILLFSPPFFVFAMEARLDTGVMVGILAAVFFCIKGWKDPRFLIGIFPALALGFMFKSVIVFLVMPILLTYCIFYRQWSWLKSGYLWRGFLIGFVIVSPWHIAESIRFGSHFWVDYMGVQVFKRSVSTLTGTNNWYDYVRVLWLYYTPWLFVIALIGVLFVEIRVFKKALSNIPWRPLLTPLISSVVIIVLFSIARTHLSTYILPAFPFLAMFIALSFDFFYFNFEARRNVMAVFMFLFICFGAYQSIAAISSVVPVYNADQMRLAELYKTAQSQFFAPLYTYGWPYLEVLSYYGDTRPQFINPSDVAGQEIKGPFYMMATINDIVRFFVSPTVSQPGYENLKVLYTGEYLVLFYSEKDTKMPAVHR